MRCIVTLLPLALFSCGCGRVGYVSDDAGSSDGSFDASARDGGSDAPDARTGDDAAVGDTGTSGDTGAADDGGTGTCPDVCNGGCGSGECFILGSTSGGTVVCPEGLHCSVQCASIDTCQGIIDGRAAVDVEVLCEAAGTCADPIWCGTGSCRVRCRDPATCASEILCMNATDCDVRCEADQTCTSDVRCGAGPCRVDCDGMDACGSVSCGASCACDVACSGSGTCAGLSCSTGCVDGSGCSSGLLGCDTC